LQHLVERLAAWHHHLALRQRTGKVAQHLALRSLRAGPTHTPGRSLARGPGLPLPVDRRVLRSLKVVLEGRARAVGLPAHERGSPAPPHTPHGVRHLKGKVVGRDVRVNELRHHPASSRVHDAHRAVRAASAVRRVDERDIL
ncbi:MAG: hypothetical protein ACK55I_48515, partial [bacterium]